MLQQYAYRRNMGCLKVASLMLRGPYLALSLREFPGGRFLRLSYAYARFLLDRTVPAPFFPAVFHHVLCAVESVGLIYASFLGISILRHGSGGFAACSGDLASNFGVVVDKGRRVCGAKSFCEYEFTLVARAGIAAGGTVQKRRGNIELGRLCSDRMGRFPV